QFQDHPYYQYTAEFCHKYDQAAFDPDYESEPLEFFEPMVRRVFARPIRSMYLREDS
ncbi:MAG: phosphohydrolase, partial [Pseudomonadota bacterium]